MNQHRAVRTDSESDAQANQTDHRSKERRGDDPAKGPDRYFTLRDDRPGIANKLVEIRNCHTQPSLKTPVDANDSLAKEMDQEVFHRIVLDRKQDLVKSD